MITFAIYNSKGGVGKTTSAVNLAHIASLQGFKTLLWDLDPQASATFYYKVKPRIKGGTLNLMKGKNDLDDAIKHTEYENLDILPADFSSRNLELIMDSLKHAKKQFAHLSKQFSKDYDFVFIDSPPGLSLISENIIAAADYVLLPLIPTTLSIRTYEQISDYFEKEGLKKSRIIPFFTLVDNRKNIHRDIMAGSAESDSRMMNTSIPYSSEVEKMGIHRAPLLSFSKATAAQAHLELWSEIRRRTSKS
jgi:chromosome partitioning protein